MSILTIVLILIAVFAIVLLALWAYGTANRLDRLHVRAEKSWQALDSALARRAVVARTVAGSLPTWQAEVAKELKRLAGAAEGAERVDREVAENRLSGALSQVDTDNMRPQIVAELADAEARVLIARRFHNDAVRDTLSLRSRRSVRWLHLGGTAPMPTYFEIAERGQPSASTRLPLDGNRTSARVVAIDEAGRVLLWRGHDPMVPEVNFWFTVGGGVEPGESLRDAAVREIFEETGLKLGADALHGPMWRRIAIFEFNGELIRSEELFFAAQVENFTPQAAKLTDVERRALTGHKWCTADDIRALVEAGEAVYPQQLAELLAEAVAVAAAEQEPQVRDVQ